VGEKGHFFHQEIVLPNTLKLLNLGPDDSLLDVACGQGVLGRAIPNTVRYFGVDIAKTLIEEARKLDRIHNHHYVQADVTQKIPVDEKFGFATIILALQNIKEPGKTINLISEKLVKGGKLLIVLNHPAFRIPRQSSWEIDKENKMQYRRVNRYMSPLEIPINMHPGQDKSSFTWTFHLPIQEYSDMLFRNGFLIEKIEEWTSHKTSAGKAANMENRARDEFPMFMAILAVKK
jgi:ubiquinone/menaquinone biosynthesis C-methylase UbiE